MVRSIRKRDAAAQAAFTRLAERVMNIAPVQRELYLQHIQREALSAVFERIGQHPAVRAYLNSGAVCHLTVRAAWGTIRPSRMAYLLAVWAGNYPPFRGRITQARLARNLYREVPAFRLFCSADSLRDSMYKASSRLPKEVKEAIIDAIWACA